jgi:hypothetical protein
MVCMNMKPRARASRALFTVLLAVILPAVPLCAQISIRNPSLPQEETLVYAEKIQGRSSIMTVSLVFKSADGDAWYEFTSKSSESEVSMRLDAATLSARYSQVITSSEDSVIRRTTEILAATSHAKQGELLIEDFNSFPVTLRGLPWGTFTSVNLVTLGAARGGQQFSVHLAVVGRESISAGGKAYDCWKVQLSLGGFLGAFLGKSSYWFTVDAPHVLVRSEGPTGGPGSPVKTTELQSYSAREK